MSPTFFPASDLKFSSRSTSMPNFTTGLAGGAAWASAAEAASATRSNAVRANGLVIDQFSLELGRFVAFLAKTGSFRKFSEAAGAGSNNHVSIKASCALISISGGRGVRARARPHTYLPLCALTVALAHDDNRGSSKT